MIHTGRISDCNRDHPDCNGVTNNADHMFWDCAKWNEVRDKYKKQIDYMIQKLISIPDHRGKERAKKLKHILSLPVFGQMWHLPG